MYQATRHLLGLGHEKILLVIRECGQNLHAEMYDELVDGYSDALADAGIIPDARHLFFCNGYNLEDGCDSAQKVLESGIDFTAVICLGRSVARGFRKRFGEAGRTAPLHYSLLCYDSYVDETISSYYWSISELAYQLACNLIKQPFFQKLYPVSFHEGSTIREVT